MTAFARQGGDTKQLQTARAGYTLIA